MNYNIFFSWQSDLPNKSNRSALKTCIQHALKNLNKKIGDIFNYDESTLSKTGSPDIGNSIIEKICKADIFICDISIINKGSKFRKCPNPNVIFELGYASSHIGWKRILCIFNLDSGKIEDLPFDINHKRIITYSAKDSEFKNKLSSIIYSSINTMRSNGVLYNPLKDNLKGKIDYCLLEIIKQLCCITYGTMTMSESLAKVSDFLNLNKETICEKLKDGHQILGYFTKNDLQYVRDMLDTIFTMITSSNIYETKWALIVLEIIDWLRSYQWYISKRSKKPLFTEAIQAISLYEIIYDKKTILLKKVGTNTGQVIYSASMPKYNKMMLLTFQKIIDDNINNYANCFSDISIITNKWLDITGSEFILDPDYYNLEPLNPINITKS